MKKIVTVLFCFYIFNSAYSQTPEQRERIISSYDKTEISNLLERLDFKETQRLERVEQFLKNNPNVKRIKIVDGQKHHLYDVVDSFPIYVSSYALETLIATSTNTLHPGGSLGLNLEGDNMNVGLWEVDGYPLKTHVEYDDGNGTSRVTFPDTPNPLPPADSHAAHVAGIIIAKGVNPSAIGMATKANLLAYNYTNDLNEVSIAASNGLLVSNQSYGVYIENAPAWAMGCYEEECIAWDDVAYTMPYYLQVTSAGNSGGESYIGGLAPGYDKLTYDKNAKNNLVIANATAQVDVFAGTMTSFGIAPSSSQGPTDDGRVKPDIAGEGTQVFSTLETGNTAYGSSSGTSMSSPNVAGSLILLQEHYSNLHGGAFMRSSTIKGLVCHTALDDNLKAGPDPNFGWGLLDSEFAAETLTNANGQSAIVDELTLNDGDTYSISFIIDGSEPLKASVCWTDPVGPSQAGILNSPTPVLINDLDIRITDSGGTEYFPWKLPTGNPTGLAVKEDNTVDNMERVDISAPTPGVYTVTVSHKGTLTNGSQNYALIVTGGNFILSNDEFLASNFKIWPNPVNDKLNYSFESASTDNTLFQIYDLNGRMVYSDSINSFGSTISGSIDMSSFSKGVYFVKIRQGTSIKTLKVVH